MHTLYMPYVLPLWTPLTCLTCTLTHIMCTPYALYVHPLHLHAPLSALHIALTHLMLTLYMPYVHPLQDTDWLIVPTTVNQIIAFNSLIYIKY